MKLFVNETMKELHIHNEEYYITSSDLKNGELINKCCNILLGHILNNTDKRIKSFKNFPDIVESINLDNNEISNFDNCPIVINNVFLYNNKLTSLKGAPNRVKGLFDVSNNELTSLEYFPEFVGRSIYIGKNKIDSFKHINYVGNTIYAGDIVFKEIDLQFNECEYTLHIDYVENLYHTCKLKSVQCANKKIEANFVNFYLEKKSLTINQYFSKLFIYCKEIEAFDNINWPEEFIKTLNEEDKSLINSIIGIDKFDL